MEHILKEGKNGLKQDLLIYGKEYSLKREGVSIGIGIYTYDENIGDCFLKETSQNEVEVLIPDEWEFFK